MMIIRNRVEGSQWYHGHMDETLACGHTVERLELPSLIAFPKAGAKGLDNFHHEETIKVRRQACLVFDLNITQRGKI